MEKAKSYLAENIYFLCGMICLLAANAPNIYGAIVHGKTAPIGYIILLQLGLSFYLIDAILKKRPSIFVISGVLNTTLNLFVLILAISV